MNINDKLNRLQKELMNPNTKIIAVSKFATVSQISEAYSAGLKDFGENKLQVYAEKWAELPENVRENIHWHFIGHLQTNKVKKVIGTFKLIHSVDSLKLAEVISEEAEKANITQEILLEVNTSGEESKYGFNKEDLKQTFLKILELKNVKVKGLMTMAPFTDDEDIQRECFKTLRLTKENLEKTFNYELTELSMGMSNDYRVAVEEGSTMIRIGQKLFSMYEI